MHLLPPDTLCQHHSCIMDEWTDHMVAEPHGGAPQSPIDLLSRRYVTVLRAINPRAGSVHADMSHHEWVEGPDSLAEAM